MSEELYDEFGNLIGVPDTDVSSDEEMDDQQTKLVVRQPGLQEVFGADVETVIATTDAKDISEPIVEPEVERNFKIEETELPETFYSKDYMWKLSYLPERVRNIALVGGLHSGKTAFLDMLVHETHNLDTPFAKDFKPMRYTDNHTIEIKRGLSIKTSSITLLMPDFKQTSRVVNILDAPGHVNFVDEMAVAIRLADTAMLVVDSVEGMTRGLQLAIDHCLLTNTPMSLNISKIDRLILELRLPPLDAYYRLRAVIHEINQYIASSELVQNSKYSRPTKLSPELNNVCFSSHTLNFCFTLRSFAQKYVTNSKLDVDSFASKLWGDIYYADKKFTIRPENKAGAANNRTFVSFVLNPIYKLTTTTLTKTPKQLQSYLESVHGITSIHRSKYQLDVQLLLKEVFFAYFGTVSTPFVDLVQYALSPVENNPHKFNLLYKSTAPETIANEISKCDPDGPLIAYVAKLVDSVDANRFYAQVRVLSGTLKAGSSVLLLGENYSPEFTDDIKVQDVRRTFIGCSRYRINVEGIPAGSIGLISGHDIDSFITKTATIFDTKFKSESLDIFKPLDMISKPVFKIPVQPAVPSELSKFIDGLKKLNRSYIGCEVKVEEGGEHIILGYGELYLDCLLHDLRLLYAGVDLKVGDPTSRFAETCLDMSKVKIVSESTNKKNSITVIAEPLEEQITKDIDSGVLVTNVPQRVLAKELRTKYGWDSLAARSIWTFGPDETGTCVLNDDTLPEETDKARLSSLRDLIVQGFKWSTREGPLCDEPVKSVKFRIIEASLSSNFLEANGAQIIQMVRKACYTAMMTATPRLLEPIYEIEILCFSSVVPALNKLLDKRRGTITKDLPVEGTPLYKVYGYIPVIESIGLETDIRMYTRGQAMCQLVFSHWNVVPGDPLDEDCYIPVLKPAPINSLSRDFTLKTRKMKGIEDVPSLKKYVDTDIYEKLQTAGIV
ncbi:hypothetical protein OGAPHI_005639 [Ogataea philodendri]|uniref:Tr-type G domain-containing protein n=1 Tax=Ogataea philodendri TaxID=1378263 RepID=A0A9P8NZF0_9ASCO|nr:uncharacterized protein OGAPHI_005639 [Ogataea philodendri]KAH3662387.1 hypothetical protein OGAPHI_005639 [Ogataea philodendri]